MNEENEGILVELCADHFERLVSGKPCDQCPANIENEATVKAMSRIIKHDMQDFQSATVRELKSIRRHEDEVRLRMKNIENKIIGNGKPGIDTRITVLETVMTNRGRNISVTLSLLAIVCTVILAFVELLNR